jgi:hypothetical protein
MLQRLLLLQMRKSNNTTIIDAFSWCRNGAVYITSNCPVKDAKGPNLPIRPLHRGRGHGPRPRSAFDGLSRVATMLLLRSEGGVNSTMARGRSSGAAVMRNSQAG